MKKEKIEVLIPETPFEIPLLRYQKYGELEDSERADFYNAVSVLAGVDMEMAKQIKARDVGRAVAALIRALSATDMELIRKIEIKGVMYGFEPDLNDITIGMLADICEQIDQPKNWHKVLAKLYRPIIRESKRMGGVYAIEPHVFPSENYNYRCEVMKDAPAALFISVRAFFLTGSKILNRATRDFFILNQKNNRQTKGRRRN